MVVAREYDDEVVSVILHAFHELGDGFLGKPRVGVRIGHEGVGLVDEQNPAPRLLNDVIDLFVRVADVFGDQVFRRDLHELVLRDDADLVQHGRYDAGDGGLSRSRVSREQHVHAR